MKKDLSETRYRHKLRNARGLTEGSFAHAHTETFAPPIAERTCMRAGTDPEIFHGGGCTVYFTILNYGGGWQAMIYLYPHSILDKVKGSGVLPVYY